MYTICHPILTIGSASGAPPVLPDPAEELTTFPILLAFTQSLAIAASGLSCLQLPHSDIRVGFLAFNPRLMAWASSGIRVRD